MRTLEGVTGSLAVATCELDPLEIPDLLDIQHVVVDLHERHLLELHVVAQRVNAADRVRFFSYATLAYPTGTHAIPHPPPPTGRPPTPPARRAEACGPDHLAGWAMHAAGAQRCSLRSPVLAKDRTRSPSLTLPADDPGHGRRFRCQPRDIARTHG